MASYPERKAPVIGPDGVRFDVSTATHPNTWAIVDLADWPAIADLRWSATKRKNGLYVRCWVVGLLHRHLMEPPAEMVIDHRDGDPLNNRRANLRICSQGDNNTFGTDRRRGFSIVVESADEPTLPHVVKRRLASGITKEYRYPTRSSTGTKRVQIRKRSVPR